MRASVCVPAQATVMCVCVYVCDRERKWGKGERKSERGEVGRGWGWRLEARIKPRTTGYVGKTANI